ncbi:phosphodiester glycosidase family protein [Actinoplanes solisilvae]|uniref:phosphodiester glycosidase family protein n=1 Tax=Actinoplanes solisilvae TaxID=2486853 RepID=UPI000FD9B4B1|nr:phosphodiester glycosidase family protein [Actinoplanes solisilvae]
MKHKGLVVGTIAAAATLLATPATASAAPAQPQPQPPVTGGIPLVDTVEKIGPGIDLKSVKALESTGWYDARFLTVDLSNKAVGTDLLTAGPVASGGPLSEAANKAGAVAGVNGEFFDIGGSTAALGAEIQDGRLLKTSDVNGRQHVGVSKDGIAQLVDVAVDAKATFAGADHKVLTINAANGGGVPADGLVAYTPGWGTYSRGRGFAGVDAVEAVVVGGKVVSVGAPGAGQLPENAFTLVGRDAAAVSLRALQAGDAVALNYEMSNDATKAMKFALGNGGTVVKGGKVVPGLDPSIAPRTALGFKDGGRTLVLATWDGPGGTGKGGVGIDKEARDLAALGVETAVNLDGGGSTTMVARELGGDQATVRNVPSDGHERNDPNGVGVFVTKGDGKLHDLIITPADDPKVFPGLHRTLTARGVDNHQAPVAVQPNSVRWYAIGGSVKSGVVQAPSRESSDVLVTATSGHEIATSKVKVLGALDSVELSAGRLSIAEATPEQAATVSVTGRDDEGYTAPIDPADLKLDYDHSVVDVQSVDGKLKVVPLKAAATILTISVAGKSVQLPITVGVQNVTAYEFTDDVLARWRNNSTAATTFSKDADGLKIDFPAMRNVGISATSVAGRVPVAGQPLRVRARIKSSISVPSGLTYLGYYDGNGKASGVYGTALVASNDWQNATWTLPANTVFPISIASFQGINTSVADQRAGTFIINRFEADVPTSIDLPAQEDLVADRLISADGTLPRGSFKFASMSDVQFTADNPAMTKVATAEIRRIRATNPDLIILNGDITDRGLPQDLSLARQVLTDAGCDLVAAGQSPSGKAGTVPCYYVPGNHESYGLNNTQSDLTNFTNEFGQPYRTFDHKGTRFILLASSLGTLRTSAWAQWPMFQQALADAATNKTIKNVVVAAHHPVDDPAETKSSQLTDRNEAALIEKMLTDFRGRSNKGAMMMGSHAQIANVHRLEGVPYFVHPSSGKDPYGTPDRGGFTGWVDWSVSSGSDWLSADVRAFAQSITLNTPAQVDLGKKVELSGSIVQPSGVDNGSRVVPLRYPMSVHWSGSSNLAIGTGSSAVADARRAGKVAILDPATRELTALRRGVVTVAVTNESMREYTGEESLAPVTTSKTIQVGPAAPAGPGFSATTPAFTAQPVGWIGQVRDVKVTNTGDQPLRISSVKVEGTRTPFRVDRDRCEDRTVAPGASCTVSVRFAPVQPDVTYTASLVFKTNTTARTESVALTGTSTKFHWHAWPLAD